MSRFRFAYGSDPLSYDLKAALEAAKTTALRVKSRDTKVTYGYGYATKQKPSGNKVHAVVHRLDGTIAIPTMPVTEKALRRHVRRFGPEGIAEVARAELPAAQAESVALLGAKKLSRRRKTTDTLREQVAALHERGMVPLAIADALNISDGRCRRLLPSATPRGRGSTKTRSGFGSTKPQKNAMSDSLMSEPSEDA